MGTHRAVAQPGHILMMAADHEMKETPPPNSVEVTV